MSWPAPVTLQGDYVTLIPLMMDHASALAEAAKDGELWNLWYASVPKPENMAKEIQLFLIIPAVKQLSVLVRNLMACYAIIVSWRMALFVIIVFTVLLITSGRQ